MAEKWEYQVSRITWNYKKRIFQASLPNGQQSEDSDIGNLLSYWGAEGWEMVSVAVERYDHEWGIGGTRVAVQYRAFFKRRKP